MMVVLFAISLIIIIAGIIISIINEVFIDGNFKIFKISVAIILIGFVFFEVIAFYMLFSLL